MAGFDTNAHTAYGKGKLKLKLKMEKMWMVREGQKRKKSGSKDEVLLWS